MQPTNPNPRNWNKNQPPVTRQMLPGSNPNRKPQAAKNLIETKPLTETKSLYCYDPYEDVPCQDHN